MIDYILINSKNRTALSLSSSDFYIELPKLYQNVSRVKLLSSLISNTIYNVSNNNNKLKYIELNGSPTTITVTLTNGIYTATQLSNHLSAIMTSNSANAISYAVTYNSQTMKFTFVASILSFKFDFSSLSNNCGYEIGFTETYIGSSFSSSVVPPNVIRIVNLCVLIETEILNTIQTSNPMVNCTWMVELPQVGSFSGSYSNTTYDYCVEADTNIRTLHFRLKNGNNQILDFNGSDNMFLLEIEFEG